MKSKLVVKPTPEFGKGEKGLFAKENIKLDEIVIKMNADKIVRYTEDEWKDKYEKSKKKIPHDGAIYSSRVKAWVSDWASNRTPRWYRLNHSNKPNLIALWKGSPKEDAKKKGTLVWRALRKIKAGEQVKFDYGDVDESWNTD